MKEERQEDNIAVTYLSEAACPVSKALRLVFRVLVVGIGCRKGTPMAALEEAVCAVLTKEGFDRLAIASFASIDLKKEEPGLTKLAAGWSLPFTTYTPQELSLCEGGDSASEFVLAVTGVPNVCERAALCGCVESGKKGRLLVKKTVFPGVTVAVAVKEKKLRFGKEEECEETGR